MTLTAGIVITGTEVISGIRGDRNGPWLATRLRELGIEPVQISIVGDRPNDLEGALRYLREAGVALIVTSGGLGPTEDDLTAAVVGRFQGRELYLDQALEERIGRIVTAIARRFPNASAEALAAGTRKQATVPRGATVLDPVGTAPGLIVPPAVGERPLVLVLPGPPRELQPMFQAALAKEPLAGLLKQARPRELGVVRLFGIPESELMATIRAAREEGVSLEGLEITTCLHRGELEVTTAYPPELGERYRRFVDYLCERHGEEVFSTDGRTIDQVVADLLVERGLTIATAESCTGGLLAGRLTDLPGSSRYFKGGVVAYANEAKEGLVGVDPALLASHGAVSEPVALALAKGATVALRAEVGVGITGIAGPGGGTPEKPVGLVYLACHRADLGKAVAVRVELPGGREAVRERATTVALHLVRRELTRR
jgi:nicotinamide-nucleotide amidase